MSAIRCESASAQSGVPKPIDRERPCARLPGLLAPLAVDEGDVGAHAGVLRDVAVEAVAHLDLEVLGGDVVEELPGLRILAVDDRDHLEQLVEGNRDRRRLDGEFDHQTVPSPYEQDRCQKSSTATNVQPAGRTKRNRAKRVSVARAAGEGHRNAVELRHSVGRRRRTRAPEARLRARSHGGLAHEIR